MLSKCLPVLLLLTSSFQVLAHRHSDIFNHYRVVHLTNVRTTSECSTALATPAPPNLHCGDQGSLKAPQTLGTSQQDGLIGCRNFCLNSKGCQSFNYNAATKQCKAFSSTLEAQGFTPGANGVVNYNRACYKKTDCTVLVRETIYSEHARCASTALVVCHKKSCTASAAAAAAGICTCAPCTNICGTMSTVLTCNRASCGAGAAAAAAATCVTQTVTSYPATCSPSNTPPASRRDIAEKRDDKKAHAFGARDVLPRPTAVTKIDPAGLLIDLGEHKGNQVDLHFSTTKGGQAYATARTATVVVK